MFTENAPHLDLHGEIVNMVEVLVNEFIKDNYLEKKDLIVIIHGKSTNILTEEVHRVLKKNNLVASFKINNWNLGETIVNLKK